MTNFGSSANGGHLVHKTEAQAGDRQQKFQPACSKRLITGFVSKTIGSSSNTCPNCFEA